MIHPWFPSYRAAALTPVPNLIYMLTNIWPCIHPTTYPNTYTHTYVPFNPPNHLANHLVMVYMSCQEEPCYWGSRPSRDDLKGSDSKKWIILVCFITKEMHNQHLYLVQNCQGRPGLEFLLYMGCHAKGQWTDESRLTDKTEFSFMLYYCEYVLNLTPYTSSPTIPFQILVSASLAPYLPSPTILSW